jgi:hypothetical protein
MRNLAIVFALFTCSLGLSSASAWNQDAPGIEPGWLSLYFDVDATALSTHIGEGQLQSDDDEIWSGWSAWAFDQWIDEGSLDIPFWAVTSSGNLGCSMSSNGTNEISAVSGCLSAPCDDQLVRVRRYRNLDGDYSTTDEVDICFAARTSAGDIDWVVSGEPLHQSSNLDKEDFLHRLLQASGRAFGLGTSSLSDAVMSADGDSVYRYRSLSADDIRGVRSIMSDYHWEPDEIRYQRSQDYQLGSSMTSPQVLTSSTTLPSGRMDAVVGRNDSGSYRVFFSGFYHFFDIATKVSSYSYGSSSANPSIDTEFVYGPSSVYERNLASNWSSAGNHALVVSKGNTGQDDSGKVHIFVTNDDFDSYTERVWDKDFISAVDIAYDGHRDKYLLCGVTRDQQPYVSCYHTDDFLDFYKAYGRSECDDEIDHDCLFSTSPMLSTFVEPQVSCRADGECVITAADERLQFRTKWLREYNAYGDYVDENGNVIVADLYYGGYAAVHALMIYGNLTWWESFADGTKNAVDRTFRVMEASDVTMNSSGVTSIALNDGPNDDVLLEVEPGMSFLPPSVYLQYDYFPTAGATLAQGATTPDLFRVDNHEELGGTLRPDEVGFHHDAFGPYTSSTFERGVTLAGSPSRAYFHALWLR